VFDPESGAARLYVGALSGPPQALDGLAAKLARQGASAATEAAIAEAVAPVAGAEPGERRMRGAVVARALKQVFAP
jgi:carbon-monoxide dehydrogenase medium subunit